MAVTDDLRDATAEQAKTLAELRRLVGEDPFLYVVLERLAEGQRDLEEVGGAAAARIMLLEAKVARMRAEYEALAAENVDLVSEIENIEPDYDVTSLVTRTLHLRTEPERTFVTRTLHLRTDN